MCVRGAVKRRFPGTCCVPARLADTGELQGRPPPLAGLCFLSTSVTVFLGYTHHTGAEPGSLRPLEGEHATPPAPVRTAPDLSHSACLVELPHFRFRKEPQRGHDISAALHLASCIASSAPGAGRGGSVETPGQDGPR